MSVFDLFRRFFEPPGMRDPFFGGMTQDDDDDDDNDDDDEDDDDFFRHAPGGRFHSPFWHRNSPFHDPFGFEDIFRDFNELFSDFGSVIRDVPRLPGVEAPRTSPERSRGSSLRDSMLKYPDSYLSREESPSSQDSSTKEDQQQPRWTPRWDRRWHEDRGLVPPSEDGKQDKVLDSEISSRDLDSIIRPREPKSSTYFRSVSVSKVMRPDGTVEERRTVRDSQGNTTTTVTVTRGDEVISSGHPESPRDTIIDRDNIIGDQPQSLPDLSDTQSILSRIFQRWFSSR